MWIAAGVAAQATSVLCLRYAQKISGRSASGRSFALAAVGLATLIASFMFFVQALGSELGTTWALLTISLIAYALILLPFFSTASVGHNRVPRRTKAMPASISTSSVRLVVRLLSAGPLYLICALATSLLVTTKPWAQEITRLFTGGLLTPVFWSLGALHATVDTRLWRVVALPVALTGVAAAIHLLT